MGVLRMLTLLTKSHRQCANETQIMIQVFKRKERKKERKEERKKRRRKERRKKGKKKKGKKKKGKKKERKEIRQISAERISGDKRTKTINFGQSFASVNTPAFEAR